MLVVLCIVIYENHSCPQGPRSFWSAPWIGPTPEVRDWRTSRHSAHAQRQVWQIWLDLVSIYFVYKAIQNQNVVGPGQRSRFFCWPEGTRPLGTRMYEKDLWIYEKHVIELQEIKISLSISLTGTCSTCRSQIMNTSLWKINYAIFIPITIINQYRMCPSKHLVFNM